MVELKFSRIVHLALYPTAAASAALSPYHREAQRQEPRSGSRAGRRGARTLSPSSTAAGPYRHATQRQGFF
jgi:hypothetical protein